MKKDNADPVDNVDSQVNGQPAGEARKAKKESDGVRLPVLIEFTYTIAMLLLLFLGLTVIVTALLSGASLLTLIIRTGVTLLLMGGLVMLIFSQISSGMLFASLVELDEQQKPPAEEADHSVGIENQSKAEA
jgi:hypothetical protein